MMHHRSALVVAVLHVLLAGAAAMSGCDDASSVTPSDGGSGVDASDGSRQADAFVPLDGSTVSDAEAGVSADASDAGTPVRITFEARVGAQPFRCGDTYTGVGDPPREITPVDFRFYVHDVRLVSADGGDVPLTLTRSASQLPNVALLDFEASTGACTDGDSTTNVEVVGHVPEPVAPGGLKFRLGVPIASNHEDLSSQPPPLDKSSLFWAWQSGHIFFAAVARARLPSDAGTIPFNHYTHLGSVGCVGNPSSGIPVTSCAKPNRPEVVLATFDAAANKVIVDFAAVKAGTDLASKGCHADGDQCATAYGHLGIDWTTGSYTGAQSVFGVE